jgi:amino acid transporter
VIVETPRQQFFKRNLPPTLCVVAGFWCLLLAIGFFVWIFQANDDFTVLMCGVAAIMFFVFAVKSLLVLGSRTKTEELAERFSGLDLIRFPIYLPAAFIVWVASFFKPD